MINICLTQVINSNRPSAGDAGTRALKPRLRVARSMLPEEARNEPGERWRLAGAELDRPASCHRYEAEARHLLSGIGALGRTRAQTLENGATELLNDDPADNVDGAD